MIVSTERDELADILDVTGAGGPILRYCSLPSDCSPLIRELMATHLGLNLLMDIFFRVDPAVSPKRMTA